MLRAHKQKGPCAPQPFALQAQTFVLGKAPINRAVDGRILRNVPSPNSCHLPLLSAVWSQTTGHPSQRQSLLLLIYFASSLSIPCQEKGYILFRRHLGFCPMRHEGCCNLWKFSNRAYTRVPQREMLNETALQEVKIPYNAFLINLSRFTALTVATDKICLI